MKKAKKLISKVAKAAAESALKRDANNTTCIAIFQPKVPADLGRFKGKQR